MALHVTDGMAESGRREGWQGWFISRFYPGEMDVGRGYDSMVCEVGRLCCSNHSVRGTFSMRSKLVEAVLMERNPALSHCCKLSISPSKMSRLSSSTRYR